MKTFVTAVLFAIGAAANAQLKFLLEDFEGFDKGSRQLTESGFFTFGDLKQDIELSKSTGAAYSGARCLRVSKVGRSEFGGWGKGVSLNVELDQRFDYLNFYVFSERR